MADPPQCEALGGKVKKSKNTLLHCYIVKLLSCYKPSFPPSRLGGNDGLVVLVLYSKKAIRQLADQPRRLGGPTTGWR